MVATPYTILTSVPRPFQFQSLILSSSSSVPLRRGSTFFLRTIKASALSLFSKGVYHSSAILHRVLGGNDPETLPRLIPAHIPRSPPFPSFFPAPARPFCLPEISRLYPSLCPLVVARLVITPLHLRLQPTPHNRCASVQNPRRFASLLPRGFDCLHMTPSLFPHPLTLLTSFFRRIQPLRRIAAHPFSPFLSSPQP